MKKLFFLIAVICFVSFNSDAQPRKIKTGEYTEVVEGVDSVGRYEIATTYHTGIILASGAGQNWKLDAAIGTQFYVGDNDWKAKFKDWWNVPAVDLFLTKWISPRFGVGFGFTYSPMKGLYQSTDEIASFRTDEFYGSYGSQQLYRQKGHTFNPYVIAHTNLLDIFGGFVPDRDYNLDLYAGGGLIFGNDPVQLRYGATFNMGLQNSVKLTKYLNLAINLRGSLVSDSFDGESRQTEKQTPQHIKNNKPYDITFGATAGIIYRFHSDVKEWEEFNHSSKTYTEIHLVRKQVQDLKKELTEVKEQNEVLIKTIIDTVAIIKNNENVVIKTLDTQKLWYHVQFIIDKWDVLNCEKVNLAIVADFIKTHLGQQFSLCGFADKQTAGPKHNLMLSKNRVNEVYKVLTKEFGVNPSQLVKDYKGGVDIMFYGDNTVSRCVIIKTIDAEPAVIY